MSQPIEHRSVYQFILRIFLFSSQYLIYAKQVIMCTEASVIFQSRYAIMHLKAACVDF